MASCCTKRHKEAERAGIAVDHPEYQTRCTAARPLTCQPLSCGTPSIMWCEVASMRSSSDAMCASLAAAVARASSSRRLTRRIASSAWARRAIFASSKAAAWADNWSVSLCWLPPSWLALLAKSDVPLLPVMPAAMPKPPASLGTLGVRGIRCGLASMWPHSLRNSVRGDACGALPSNSPGKAIPSGNQPNIAAASRFRWQLRLNVSSRRNCALNTSKSSKNPAYTSIFRRTTLSTSLTYQSIS
mmetsp:Transcript_6598/g.12284  ORF Transcript_6598/g.12284 Transcript_6598/m.12284 type:complete len:244 (-) Transcript_6598:541-1272(-)